MMLLFPGSAGHALGVQYMSLTPCLYVSNSHENAATKCTGRIDLILESDRKQHRIFAEHRSTALESYERVEELSFGLSVQRFDLTCVHAQDSSNFQVDANAFLKRVREMRMFADDDPNNDAIWVDPDANV